MRQWRLIYDYPAIGAWNMAVDEAILSAVGQGDQPPTLRLYAWDPFCLSLGYGQQASDVDLTLLREHGWDIVRRPTGGRAILHGDELTYSVALPMTHEFAKGDVVSSYRLLSQSLMYALGELGIVPQSEKQSKSNSRDNGPICFEVPSHYEITILGRKLIGSAQVRRKLGLLQHGTLPLMGDVGRIALALAFSNESARMDAVDSVRNRAITLHQALGEVVSWEEAASAVAEGFRQEFDLDLIPAELSDAEKAHAEQLLVDIYANDHWTFKR
ncbi:MAG: lipoate--protein ligase family protein [Anaerolineae bacterium]|nr:lipoate--protein ligase family protein [Anaerolineae bacterium]